MKERYDTMIFSAHPDDAEMAMGGTVVQLSRSGQSVLHVSLTKAEMSTYGTVSQRLDEFNQASIVLGVDCLALDFKDTAVLNDPASRMVVARLLRTYRPTLVFAPYHTNNAAERSGIAHVDHAVSGALVRDAVKLARLAKTVPELPPHTVRKLLFYMLPSQVQPKIVVDVTANMETALKAIETYESQMAGSQNGIAIKDILLVMRSSLGLQIGVRYAEGFTTDLPLVFEARHFLET